MTLQQLPVTNLDDPNYRRRHREITNKILTHQFDDSRVRTAAEIAALVTPVNYAWPLYDVRRYGAVLDGVTDDWRAFQNAILVVEESIGASKVEGGVILIPDGTAYIGQRLRVGSWITLRGHGPFSTRINFADAVTNQCFLLETALGGQVFGTCFEDLFIGCGTNASHAIYSQGAHEWTCLRRVSIGNVNQIGVELGSLGGPYKFICEDVGITGGAAVTLSHRIGMILNNGSMNVLRDVQMYGQIGKNMEKGIRCDFGHLLASGTHFEQTDIGISCEQTQVGGHVVSLDHITGTVTVATLIDVAATFVGTLDVRNAVSGAGTNRIFNHINLDELDDEDVERYFFTSIGGASGMQRHKFPVAQTTDWANRCYSASCNIDVNNRIYAPVVGMDGSNDAIALGYYFDGTGYNVVIGGAPTPGAPITSRFTLGRLANSSPVALAFTKFDAAYGTTVNINAATGNFCDVTATNGTGFTIANPTIASPGQQLTITVRNTSGGALGAITWGTDFKMAAWTSPATANSRSITFKYNGTNWIEVGRTAADVPN